MPTVKLTPSFVRSLRGTTGGRKVDYFDSEQRGFMLEVRKRRCAPTLSCAT